MEYGLKHAVCKIMLTVLGVAVAVAGWLPPASAEEYFAIPGLSAKDRIVLATSMVEQGQCRNGLIEITEAMKDLPDDETLVRLKGVCETTLLRAEAKDTIMKWLRLAPQTHAERGKMLALLAKSQAGNDAPTDWISVPAGEFEMGAEGGTATPDEGPKHRVYVDHFLLSRYEVTNRQYQSFVKQPVIGFPKTAATRSTISGAARPWSTA